MCTSHDYHGKPLDLLIMTVDLLIMMFVWESACFEVLYQSTTILATKKMEQCSPIVCFLDDHIRSDIVSTG